jgi:arylsulfatase
VIQPGTVNNDIFAHEDFIPTFCAAAGQPDIVQKCMTGYTAGGKTFKVHLDGYNMLPFWKGEVKENPRKEFVYWSDDGDLFALRYGRWNISFIEQYHEGLDIWVKDYTKLRGPQIYDLLADPFERGPSSFEYPQWEVNHFYLTYGALAYVSKWLGTFREFPPRQKPASFNLDEVMRKMSEKPSGN